MHDRSNRHSALKLYSPLEQDPSVASAVRSKLDLIEDADRYRSEELKALIREKLPKSIGDFMIAERACGQDIEGRVAVSFQLYDRKAGQWLVPSPEVLNFSSDELGYREVESGKKILATIGRSGLWGESKQYERLQSAVTLTVKLDRNSPTGSIIDYRLEDARGVMESIDHLTGKRDSESSATGPSVSPEEKELRALKLRQKRPPAEFPDWVHADEFSISSPKDPQFSLARMTLEKSLVPFYEAWGVPLSSEDRPTILKIEELQPGRLSVKFELPAKAGEDSGIERRVTFSAELKNGELCWKPSEKPGRNL